ncbi:DNA-processing protein DprA [Fluoribacter dumoffii]|uniref:DNA protecting protein DprA n=1 Tax=Fluoribacter dumoffii TaxID=463 RepID=A0A377G7Y5_9GAMM|nr:DNA-processing protein DprA [Fluoribacter dumoffii]KTC89471.1 protein smf [Fluoribacter dumoffii NY 23]MCW8417732.1 DNA-processing protein DprA [Fluoribacter dumoffii]MCW8454426.1 DNA-processing protein DprA [Fluoribacter dumoffii]MCW8461500.1 DNA-processing protein DprA [Fluoribacter dumoffii]MCW8484938.1 DNA-processing protein DprA [Fluoribacter dumoffii]
MNNLPYYLALNRMERVGPRTVAKLQKRWPDLENMFRLSATELEQEGLSPALAQTIAGFNLNMIDEDLNWLQAADNHHILTWDSCDYPALLKEINDPPIVLYVKGVLGSLNPPKLAVVGSRNPTVTGSENARHFAKAIAAYGVTIVSGLALGIDAEAHRGCLESKGQTIAVLGTGIDQIYPRRHHSLAQQIVQNGLLISEFPLKSPPTAGHFPRRNRIISGLSLCTLVVESAIKSGSLITARMALEQNRDVLAIPGSIHNPLARGCHYLLQQGAKLVTSVADVLEELQIDSEQQSADKTTLPLASGNKNLVKFIGFEMTTVDQIILRSGCTVEQVTSELAELELNGAVVSVPGGYMRC